MMEKITSNEIYVARLIIDTFDDGQTEMSAEDRDNITRFGSLDPDVIQHLITRILNEGTLPEEQHRYLAKGVYDEWVEPGNDSMPDEIFNEFPTHDGIVQITPDEFKDILAYVAKEYFG